MGQNMWRLPKQLLSVWSCRSGPEQLWSTLEEGEKKVTWIDLASSLHIKGEAFKLTMGILHTQEAEATPAW